KFQIELNSALRTGFAPKTNGPSFRKSTLKKFTPQVSGAKARTTKPKMDKLMINELNSAATAKSLTQKKFGLSMFVPFNLSIRLLISIG
ncbi:MAG: hypothetical protein ACI85H_000995, partial [Paracoccaceae bacterium]